MDAEQFDTLTRSLTDRRSRRGALAAALGGALGVASLAGTDSGKKKKKKPKFNEFDCVNVGDFCKNSSQCCSGLCKGKKGKKRCSAHDSSTCLAGQSTCVDPVGVPCVSSTGANTASCEVTTGNAPYCTADGDCFACTKDADCVPFCGAQAACIKCATCSDGGVVTACVGPAVDGCTFPM